MGRINMYPSRESNKPPRFKVEYGKRVGIGFRVLGFLKMSTIPSLFSSARNISGMLNNAMQSTMNSAL
jgi:hypothetical protein